MSNTFADVARKFGRAVEKKAPLGVRAFFSRVTPEQHAANVEQAAAGQRKRAAEEEAAEAGPSAPKAKRIKPLSVRPLALRPRPLHSI